MRVAILLSTYNGHKYLDAQLKSLANQTVKHSITVYIRDDGSTDNTFEIIDKWSTYLNIILKKGNNLGPAKSFWELLMDKSIQADYFAFCDQDDIWDEDKIEKAVEILRNNNYSLYISNCRIIDEYDNILKEKRRKSIPELTLKRLFVSGVTQGCSMVFTSQLRDFIMSKNITVIPMHDNLLLMYSLKFGEVYWDTEPRFSYREHSNNVVAKQNKTFFKKLRTSFLTWKNNKNHSKAFVAKELLQNINNFTDEERIFLEKVSCYKKHKLWIISSCKNFKVSKAEKRSFIFRVLLGYY